MKIKAYALVFLVLVCIVFQLPISANEATAKTVETIENEEAEYTEAYGEAEIIVLNTPQKLSDDIPSGIENAEKDQLIEIINGLSGEGIDKMQTVLLAGINSIERDKSTLWDRTADFCQMHIEAISLIAFSAVVVFYMLIRVRGSKRLRRNIEISTNNAVEAVEIAKSISADNLAVLEGYTVQVERYSSVISDANARIDELLCEVRRKSLENEALRNVIKHNVDADMLVADTVNELLQLSNIPQNKKDAIYSKITEAKALISSEGNYEEQR